MSSIVMSTLDLSYGGRHGFNQAIDLASDVLSNAKFTEEKKLIQR